MDQHISDQQRLKDSINATTRPCDVQAEAKRRSWLTVPCLMRCSERTRILQVVDQVSAAKQPLLLACMLLAIDISYNWLLVR